VISFYTDYVFRFYQTQMLGGREGGLK